MNPERRKESIWCWNNKIDHEMTQFNEGRYTRLKMQRITKGRVEFNANVGMLQLAFLAVCNVVNAW